LIRRQCSDGKDRRGAADAGDGCEHLYIEENLNCLHNCARCYPDPPLASDDPDGDGVVHPNKRRMRLYEMNTRLAKMAVAAGIKTFADFYDEQKKRRARLAAAGVEIEVKDQVFNESELRPCTPFLAPMDDDKGGQFKRPATPTPLTQPPPPPPEPEPMNERADDSEDEEPPPASQEVTDGVKTPVNVEDVSKNVIDGQYGTQISRRDLASRPVDAGGSALPYGATEIVVEEEEEGNDDDDDDKKE
jgi:hypothetical protein